MLVNGCVQFGSRAMYSESQGPRTVGVKAHEQFGSRAMNSLSQGPWTV